MKEIAKITKKYVIGKTLEMLNLKTLTHNGPLLSEIQLSINCNQ